jgi:tetratricopeptide (TPR) repeat protein
VSEEAERVSSGLEGNGAGVDPTAVALALAGASREEADCFLREQRSLIGDQRHHLSEQLKQIHLDVWEKRLGVWLRAATFCVGIAVAAGLSYMMWDAAHSRGLIIEAFSVPPDLAAHGLTGEVVAGRMLDKISDMEAHVNTVRAVNTYVSNWGKDLKVDIPETGISLDELDRYLKEKLGHPTHISGDVVRTATGISVTARVGGEAGKSFSGADEEFDSLMQQAAESVYARTQPYRYGVYLEQNGKVEEGLKFFDSVVGNMSPSEQAWAYQGSYAALNLLGRAPEAAEAARMGIALNRNFAFGWDHYGTILLELGRDETALQAFRTAQRLLDQHIADDIEPTVVPRFNQEQAVRIDDLVGDYTAELREMRANQSFIGAGKVGTTRIGMGQMVWALISDHDLAAARHMSGGLGTTSVVGRGMARLDGALSSMQVSVGEEDWPRVLQIGPIAEAQMARNTAAKAVGDFYLPTEFWPNIAYALAMTGNLAAAHAEIDKTPADCDTCMRMRGRIDAAERNYAGADFWFAKAEEAAPSIPFADADWGEVLLAKGDADGAIAKFALANRKGPHFADPLEGWGEALMAKNQSHLALAKFAEANKYAPNWGRLHLKWGEALVYAGRKDEARAQFARAAQLDLTSAEKSELARHP